MVTVVQKHWTATVKLHFKSIAQWERDTKDNLKDKKTQFKTQSIENVFFCVCVVNVFSFVMFSVAWLQQWVGVVSVQRVHWFSTFTIRWFNKMNQKLKSGVFLVQLAQLQKIVTCRDKHWQLTLIVCYCSLQHCELVMLFMFPRGSILNTWSLSFHPEPSAGQRFNLSNTSFYEQILAMLVC